MPLFTFPNINPIAISIGPLNIYWYALSYVVGILFTNYYAKKLASIFSSSISPAQIENFITYAIIGIIFGGRLGYVLFYEPTRFIAEPLEIFKTYNGGMSFHGAVLGIIIAGLYYCYKNNIGFWTLFDLLSPAFPVGLFLGRIANFINGELYGRPTDVPWAIVFPYSDGKPRHPSQLYESALEGILLFIIINYFVFKRSSLKQKGKTSGIFLLFYGIFRIFIENFREPDPQLGFILGNYFTMGQILTLPMIILGIYLIIKSNLYTSINYRK